MAYVRTSDVKVGDNIYRSLSSFYGTQYKRHAGTIVTIIERALPEFRKLLNLPDKLTFRVAPIKARDTRGRCDSNGIVEIDCRLPWNQALEVLAHELVHAEQYHNGKLAMKYTSSKGWMHHWNGTPIPQPSSYLKYRALPWEKEAFARQAELAEKVCSILEKKYP